MSNPSETHQDVSASSFNVTHHQHVKPIWDGFESALMSNPSETHQHVSTSSFNVTYPQHASTSASSFNGTHHQHAYAGIHPTGEESSGAVSMHKPDIYTEWSAEEQAALEDGLSRFALESNINRCLMIAVQLLPNKTMKEIAFRCRLLSKKENNKRRKGENFGRESKDKKERVTDHPGTSSPIFPEEYISYRAIGGVRSLPLEQNALIFSQISTNLSHMRIQDNIELLRLSRDNILQSMTDSLNDMPETMRLMPPLPVRLNEELASTILPRPNLPPDCP